MDFGVWPESAIRLSPRSLSVGNRKKGRWFPLRHGSLCSTHTHPCEESTVGFSEVAALGRLGLLFNVLMTFNVAAPGFFLWLLGPKYSELRGLIGWVVLTACINYIAEAFCGRILPNYRQNIEICLERIYSAG
jgi:hypothetical protein